MNLPNRRIHIKFQSKLRTQENEYFEDKKFFNRNKKQNIENMLYHKYLPLKILATLPLPKLNSTKFNIIFHLGTTFFLKKMNKDKQSIRKNGRKNMDKNIATILTSIFWNLKGQNLFPPNRINLRSGGAFFPPLYTRNTTG